MNVSFETYGCRLNRAEALEEEARVLAQGHKIVTKHSQADVFVVRGCSVTSRAQTECEKMIKHLQKHYPNKRIIIMGCLPGAQKTLTLGARGAADVGVVTPTRTARAYLKVQDGCAGQCSFCIVPKFRGTAASEDFNATLDRAKRLIDAGYHEIVVTGCNLALYASGGRRLGELLAALAALSPECRIRLGSLEPWGPARDVVDAMAANANICRSLHLPVQSASNRILKLMNRPYTIEEVTDLITRAKDAMSTIGLGCDLITGFPGESEGDFVQTKNFLLHQNFSNAHVFPYSERPGTSAAKLPGHVRHETRSNRAHTLSDIAKQTKTRFARTFIGKEVDVVIESHTGEQMKGWTSEYLWFEGPMRLNLEDRKTSFRKQMMRFVVRSVDNGILHGVRVNHGG